MSTSVGQRLREARQARNQTLEQVSRVTYIRPIHLEALEAGNLEALPSRTQARGFLRAYALHLGLDPDPLVAQLESNGATQPDLPDTTDPAAALAADLYFEIGEALRSRRETLGVSIEEAENQTRLRRFYLEAMEFGDLDRLPSPVQGRGMLKNYAEFLGLDPDPLLLNFADGLQARLAYRRSAQPATAAGRRPAGRRLVSGDLLFGGLFLFGLIVFIIWAVGRVSAVQASQQAQATAPAIVDVLDPLPTATLTPTTAPTIDPAATAPQSESALDATPTAAPTLPITSDSPVQVYLVVIERAWMRVTVDGQVEFEGRVIPGTAFPFTGRERIQVLTSSGSSIEVFHNQADLGPMGLFGQIVERIYTADDILVPTPAISPTPSPTVTPTETPEATPIP